jgi:hypothetical protein
LLSDTVNKRGRKGRREGGREGRKEGERETERERANGWTALEVGLCGFKASELDSFLLADRY